MGPFVKTRIFCLVPLCTSLVTLFWACAPQACAASPTVTTLAISSGGQATTSVSSGSVVTLTATVSTGTTPVTVGQVKFCDAAVSYCTDIHLLGLAQVTSAGTAVFKYVPSVGSHSYKAVFVGTKNAAAEYLRNGNPGGDRASPVNNDFHDERRSEQFDTHGDGRWLGRRTANGSSVFSQREQQQRVVGHGNIGLGHDGAELPG